VDAGSTAAATRNAFWGERGGGGVAAAAGWRRSGGSG